MSQGKASKEEAGETRKVVEEIFNALPKRKQGEFFGHLNDIYLFLSAVERVLPSENP